MAAQMKTALITGAAIRIGRGIAERFLAENYRLILHANRSFDELSRWTSAHPRRDQIHLLVQGDLAHEQGQNDLIAHVSQSVSSLDLIVHNASAFLPTPFAKIDRSNFRDMMGINLDAPFFITQGLLPQLLAAEKPSVINIVDAMWQRPSPHYAHYAAAKAGLVVLTRALANEYAPHLRVNAVAPGAIIPAPFHEEAKQDLIVERIPFKRLGNVDDIANAVFFLSETALYTSGEIFVVDGARSIAP